MRASPLSDLATAAAFLTIAPAPAGGGLERLARAAGFFPVVGAAVGVAGGAVAALALWAGFGAGLAAVFAVAAQVVLTGALHEDGLADFADGLGGRDHAARLAAMRDSAVGVYGVLALGGATAIRVGALAEILATGVTRLEAPTALAALAATGALSRAALAGAMRWTERARNDGLAASAGRPPAAALALAGLSAGLCAAPAGFVFGAAATAAAALTAAAAAAALCRLAARRLGGATGDVFGAVQTVAETAALCALAAAWGA